jgi:4-cresol dehydrogenase (hydroxylating)
MADLGAALAAWEVVLGADHVLVDDATRYAAATATFATDRTVPAVLRPGTTGEVQACLRIANEHHVPLYPVSGGKNWGYGSRVPVTDGCVILDLGRLDGIRHVDERLSYAVVEPGVTFRQLYAFLREHAPGLMPSALGGPPDTSVIGNLVERGMGTGPNGDRFAHACGFEVVLPTGEIIRTGFGRFPGARAADMDRWGVGPVLDGLFSQSNLGVVTAATVMLLPRPRHMLACFVGIDSPSSLPGLIDHVRDLALAGVVTAPLKLGNDLKVLAASRQYPWQEAGGSTPMPDALRRRMRPWGSAWSGWIGLYGASELHARADAAIIRERLGEVVDRLVFVDDDGVEVAWWPAGDSRERVAARFRGFAPRESWLTGMPLVTGTQSAYWRKRTPMPLDANPDRDGCGLIWCAPVVPLLGEEVANAVGIAERTLTEYDFEPILSTTCLNRVAHMTVALTYDRDLAGEDDRAIKCHDILLEQFVEAGYIPYRLGVQSMHVLPADGSEAELARVLRQAMDPNRVLAPGRYEPPASR